MTLKSLFQWCGKYTAWNFCARVQIYKKVCQWFLFLFKDFWIPDAHVHGLDLYFATVTQLYASTIGWNLPGLSALEPAKLAKILLKSSLFSYVPTVTFLSQDFITFWLQKSIPHVISTLLTTKHFYHTLLLHRLCDISHPSWNSNSLPHVHVVIM
jgi:hypothetical protein